jgi:hypothetical protein
MSVISWVFLPGRTLQPSLMFGGKTSGLYYKHITIVNVDSNIVNMWQVSLNDNTIFVIYDRNMFIMQATEPTRVKHLSGDNVVKRFLRHGYTHK